MSQRGLNPRIRSGITQLTWFFIFSIWALSHLEKVKQGVCFFSCFLSLITCLKMAQKKEKKTCENTEHSFLSVKSLLHMVTKCQIKRIVRSSSLLFSPQRLLSNEEEKNKEIIQEVCFMVSLIHPRITRHQHQHVSAGGVALAAVWLESGTWWLRCRFQITCGLSASCE